MPIQYSLTARTNAMSQLNTSLGPTAIIKLFTGTPPATCATADAGTLLATFTGAAVNFGSAASQVLTAGAISGVTASGGTASTPGYFRIYPTAGATTTNAIAQGTSGQNVVLSTTSLSAANSNVLNMTTTTGVAVGQNISGTGVVAGSTVVAVSAGVSVTMSNTSTAGVSNATSITFGSDMPFNGTITSGQTVTITAFTVTASGA